MVGSRVYGNVLNSQQYNSISLTPCENLSFSTAYFLICLKLFLHEACRKARHLVLYGKVPYFKSLPRCPDISFRDAKLSRSF